jgi:hypothetical protein
MHALQFHRNNAPRRKLRGKRRYFARVEREAQGFVMKPGPEAWWDLWHYHADWSGWGNLGWRYRRQHLLALCTVFRKICEARAAFHTPFQTWILLNGEDAGQDATYLHTPNPNGTAFPIQPVGVVWGASALQPMMESLLPDYELEVGWTRVANADVSTDRAWSTSHWVCARGIGVPFRAG